MTTTADAPRTGAPWHLWLVGVLGLLWNGFGAYDYAMTNLQGETYMRGMGMTDAQIAFMDATPAWTTAAWALGVWGSLLGSVLLIARSRWAGLVFTASLVGLAGSVAYNYLLSDGADVMGAEGGYMYALIAVLIVFQIWYAQLMAKRGVLR